MTGVQTCALPIYVNLELGFVQIRAGKTAFARRTIPLTQRAREVLAQRLITAESEWLFPVPWDPLRPLASVRKAHISALRKSGIQPAFRLYDLRHTALTRMAMAGVDLPTLRELAGHASIQMTMRYVHPTPEHKVMAIGKLDTFRQTRQNRNEARSTAGVALLSQASSRLPVLP